MKIEVTGLKSVDDRLAKLQAKSAKKALRKGVTAGTRVISKGAKSRVRRGKGKLGGLLRKSIGTKVKTFRSGVTVGIVGPRKGFKVIPANGRKVDPVKYGHVEERGRQKVRIKKKKVLSDGKVIFGTEVVRYAGHPFMQPTLEQDAGATQAAMAVATMKSIEQEMKK